MTGRIFGSLTPTRDGLALGTGTIVVKRDADGGLAIDGHEDEIIALLSAAHGRLMPPSILGSIRAAAKAYPALTDADFEQLRHPRFAERLLLPPDAPPPPLLRVTLALALGGVPSLHATRDAEKAGRYLVQAKNRLACLSPIDLLKAQGILPKNATAILQKAYNPDEPRDAQGRWTGDGDERNIASDETASDIIDDPPIQPVYPLETVIGLILGGESLAVAREVLGILALGSVDTTAAEESALTDHGNERITERNITDGELQESIQTARQTGNTISQIGKYGTLQEIYRGSNGVTVVMETEGRNAGKIITAWRQ